MKHTTSNVLQLIVCSITLLIASGCTLKASTESLTDTMTNFLSSTTPGAWFNADGLINPDQRLNVFVAINLESLQQDMARGDGEYLTALATLLEVPKEKIPSFKARAQEQFPEVQANPKPTLDTLVAALSGINENL